MKSTFFQINELVAPEILSVLSEDAAWKLFPGNIIPSLDKLRKEYGDPIIINGSGLIYSGLRPQNCKIGSLKSAHKGFGDVQAFDLHCSDLDKLTKIITSRNSEFCIQRMENPLYCNSWRHIELCIYTPKDFCIFNP